MSYFFVDEVPQDELPNPTDKYSVLESKTPKSFNPMNNQTGNQMGQRMSTISQAKSFIYKHTEPNIFSDKAMQLKHKGLCINQIIVGQIEFMMVAKLRKNSSKFKNKEKETKQFLSPPSQKFQKVLLLLEKSKGPTNGKSSSSLMGRFFSPDKHAQGSHPRGRTGQGTRVQLPQKIQN